MKLLNLGCGQKFHKDWVNVDFLPTGKGVIQHNLLEGVPFDNDSFDVVYHSHVLEHFLKDDGERFVKECARVLKKGGILRIAVPDLERIARTYLSTLDDALKGKPNADANYRWMMLELLDQIVRNTSGGEMAKFFYEPAFKNEDFVYGRVGKEAKDIRQGYLDSLKKTAPAAQEAPPRKTLSVPTPSSIKQKVKERALRSEEKYNNIGRFRLGGEIHQWMYDRYSLKKLLEENGFKSIKVVSADKSAIPNWNTYELDAKQGIVHKPDSLFMEAIKK